VVIAERGIGRNGDDDSGYGKEAGDGEDRVGVEPGKRVGG